MQAIVFNKYGPPDTLQLKEVAKPIPKENEVLVKIHATAINDFDWSFVRGKPYLYRLIFGLTKPQSKIPGMELAGTIETVGSEVTKFKVGDAVCGDISNYGFGTFAEYISINEKALVPKPANMSFQEAAAIPHASTLAYQGLIEIGHIQPGQQILINGAGGGVGTFALQIAKRFKAEVTGVDTGPKLDMMKSLGFDHVIDYKQNDFTKNGSSYDLILDAKTNRPPFSYIRSLKEGGKYVTVGGYITSLLQILVFKPIIASTSSKSVHIVALKSNKGLDYINDLFDMGILKPIIDGPYPLEKAPELLQYFGEGRHKGKVILSINT